MISLFKNNPETDFDIYVFSSDLSEESISLLNKLHSFHQKYNLHPVYVDSQRFERLKLNIRHISVETYYRYIIADSLPNLDKILYLDADLVVLRDISDFYNQDMSSFYLSGSLDLHVKKLGYDKEIGCPNYINAGVLLMNLKKFRQDELGEKMIQKTLELQDKIQFQDQDILNIVCADHIKLADSIYNFAMRNVKQEKSKIKSAAILHYTGEKKPWGKKKSRLSSVWKKYNNILRRYKSHDTKPGLSTNRFFGVFLKLLNQLKRQ